jgi:hypothetical protein
MHVPGALPLGALEPTPLFKITFFSSYPRLQLPCNFPTDRIADPGQCVFQRSARPAEHLGSTSKI